MHLSRRAGSTAPVLLRRAAIDDARAGRIRLEKEGFLGLRVDRVRVEARRALARRIEPAQVRHAPDSNIAFEPALDLGGDVLGQDRRDRAENFFRAMSEAAPVGSLGIPLFIHLDSPKNDW